MIPVRWLAVLIGSAAMAMIMVVAIGLATRGSEPEPPAARSETPEAPRIFSDRVVGERNAQRVGGPEAVEAGAEREPPAESTPPPSLVVVEGQPGTFVWPLGGVLEQGIAFSHPGVDIAAPLGSAVRATRAGTVTFIGGDPCCSYGSYVLVQHDDTWSSRYAHLGGFAVAVGDTVAQGELLGFVGLTGRTSGPHLHFELLYNGAPVDPLAHLPAGVLPQSEAFVTGGDAPPPGDAQDDAGGSVVLTEPAPPTAPPAAPAAPTPSQAAAIVAAAGFWLQSSGEYHVDIASCGGGPAASNQWLVTCRTERANCEGACLETKLVCVIEDPLTLWAC